MASEKKPDRRQRTSTSNPGERASDKHIINIRENWYRDVWLLIITIVVVIAVAISESASHKAENVALNSAGQIHINHDLAEKAAQLAQAIQNQRINNIKENCIAQNKRHDKTLEAISKEINNAIKHPLPGMPQLSKAALRIQEAETAFIIDALQPKQDCQALVDNAIGMRPRKNATPYPPPVIPNPDEQRPR